MRVCVVRARNPHWLTQSPPPISLYERVPLHVGLNRTGGPSHWHVLDIESSNRTVGGTGDVEEGHTVGIR